MIFLILLSIPLASAVSNPKPTITTRFNETVTIISQNLTYLDETEDILLLWKNPDAAFEEFTNPLTTPSSTGFYDPIEETKPYYDYLFKPIENLAEGNYSFNISSEDDLGNQKNTSTSFTIKYESLNIGIENPPYGVSFNDTFDLIITTDSNASCKWAYDVASYAVMEEFEETTSTSFTMLDFEMTSPEQDFYVKCIDTLYSVEHSKKFTLIVDKTKPDITVNVNPQAIYEEPSPFKFNVTITTDDDTTCKYHTTEEDYEEMAIFSDVMNKTHKKGFSKTQEGTYKYNIRCKNPAGLISDLTTFSFLVNLSMPTLITLVNPTDWVTAIPFTLHVDTTRRAECWYKKSMRTSFREGSPSYEHKKDLSPTEGIHTYTIDCLTTQGSIEKPFEIKIDTNFPERPEVNDDSDLEDDKEYTYRTDRLRAVFTAKDSASGISNFNYSIVNKSNNAVIDEGMVDSGNCNENKTCVKTVNIDGLDLQDKSTYFFKVNAIDAAGLTSTDRHSNGITVDITKKPVEKTNPKGWTTKGEVDDGIKVTLHCVDQGTDKSGCAPSLYEYSTASSSDGCTSYYSYSEPILFEESGWFCWLVSDNAGNIAEGYEAINITEPDRRDRDTDGVLDIEDNCPGISNQYQEDTDSDDIGDECDNCLRRYNPSQYDSDNDNIGDSCDTCAETPSGASVNSYGCAMTQEPDDEDEDDADRDGDGIPNDWEEDNNLDPDDPDDADLDDDEDGLTNKQEYTYRTNPNKADTDGDSFTDSEEISQGTDPLDPNSTPKKGSVWSVLLLIFGILVLLGGIGYFGYTYYFKEKMEFKPKPLQGMPTGFRPRPAQRPIRRPMPGQRRPMPRRRMLTPQQQQMLMKRRLEKRTSKQAERSKVFSTFTKKPGITPTTKPPASKPFKAQSPKPQIKPPIGKGLKPVPKPSAKPKSAVERLKGIGGKKKEDIFSKLSSIGKKK